MILLRIVTALARGRGKGREAAGCEVAAARVESALYAGGLLRIRSKTTGRTAFVLARRGGTVVLPKGF